MVDVTRRQVLQSGGVAGLLLMPGAADADGTPTAATRVPSGPGSQLSMRT